MEEWELQAAHEAAKSAAKAVWSATRSYLAAEEGRMREAVAETEPGLDPDLYVANWLAMLVHQNRGSWSGELGPARNANEVMIRELAARRLQALLQTKLSRDRMK